MHPIPLFSLWGLLEAEVVWPLPRVGQLAGVQNQATQCCRLTSVVLESWFTRLARLDRDVRK